MALLYICDYCGQEYEAEINQTLTKQAFGGNDSDLLVYHDGAKRNRIGSEKEPCKRCKEVAEKAKTEALAKRKAAVQQEK